jgi:membrane protein involved in colicin uptake
VRLVSDLDMGTMRKAAQAESSSVLFSLGELMKLEEQRIEEERHVVDAQRAAVERARVEAEARAAREQAMRLEAERARRELEGRERAVEDLQRERDAATDARKKAELDAKIASEEIKIRELRGRGRLPPPIDDKKPIKKNCGNADDPLNPCL